MEKPILSPDFTLEDIRKIREFDYTEWRKDNLFKDMSVEDIHAKAMNNEQ
jgi:hypothetical protein